MTDLSARANALGVREIRNMPFQGVELREKADAAGTLGFTGYACVTEQAYEMQDWAGSYEEVVRAGAFTKTLAEGADVAFLVNHEGMTMARTKSGTLRLSEDDKGLHVDADLDAASPMGMSIRSAMERGDMDEMSFAFRVTRQQWSPDFDQRDILEVNIHKGDVSLVNYGANPYTSAAMRALAGGRAFDLRRLRGVSFKNLSDGLLDLRAGKALSAATMETLQTVLDLVASADDSVDEAQLVLSDLMGVPNPDDEEAPPSDPEAKAALPLSLAVAMARAAAARAA